MNQLMGRVRAARRRLMLSRALQASVVVLAIAGTASAALVWLKPAWAVWPLAAAAVAPLVFAVATRPSLRTAALALDKACGLDERVTTALACTTDDPASRAVIEDAVEASKGADASRVPLGRPRGLPWLAAPVVVLLAGFLLPRALATEDPEADPAAVPVAAVPAPIRKAESEKLSRRAFDLEKKAQELQSPKMKEIAQEMRQTAEEMKKKEIDPAKALAKLSELEQKAKERREELSKAAGMNDKTLQKSGSETAGSSAQERAELQQKLSEAMQKLAEAKAMLAKGGAQSKEKFEKALRDAAEKLKQGGNDAKAKELAQELEELADKADEMSQEELDKELKELDGELADLDDVLGEMDALEDELEALKAMKGEFSGKFERCLFCGKLSGD